jgi:hypothetical protein
MLSNLKRKASPLDKLNAQQFDRMQRHRAASERHRAQSAVKAVADAQLKAAATPKLRNGQPRQSVRITGSRRKAMPTAREVLDAQNRAIQHGTGYIDPTDKHHVIDDRRGTDPRTRCTCDKAIVLRYEPFDPTKPASLQRAGGFRPLRFDRWREYIGRDDAGMPLKQWRSGLRDVSAEYVTPGDDVALQLTQHFRCRGCWPCKLVQKQKWFLYSLDETLRSKRTRFTTVTFAKEVHDIAEMEARREFEAQLPLLIDIQTGNGFVRPVLSLYLWSNLTRDEKYRKVRSWLNANIVNPMVMSWRGSASNKRGHIPLRVLKVDEPHEAKRVKIRKNGRGPTGLNEGSSHFHMLLHETTGARLADDFMHERKMWRARQLQKKHPLLALIKTQNLIFIWNEIIWDPKPVRIVELRNDPTKCRYVTKYISKSLTSRVAASRYYGRLPEVKDEHGNVLHPAMAGYRPARPEPDVMPGDIRPSVIGAFTDAIATAFEGTAVVERHMGPVGRVFSCDQLGAGATEADRAEATPEGTPLFIPEPAKVKTQRDAKWRFKKHRRTQ